MFVQLFCALCFAVAVLNGQLLDPACETISVDPNTCCQSPGFAPNDVQEQQLAICSRQISVSGLTAGVGLNAMFTPYMRCFAECMFNVTGILKDGQIQLDAAINSFNPYFDQEWTSVFPIAFNTCKSAVAKAKFDTSQSAECSFTSAYFLGCIVTQLFKVR